MTETVGFSTSDTSSRLAMPPRHGVAAAAAAAALFHVFLPRVICCEALTAFFFLFAFSFAFFCCAAPDESRQSEGDLK